MRPANPNCTECKGTGKVNRKVWEDTPNIPVVHPSVLAGVPAQRTIKQFACECTLTRSCIECGGEGCVYCTPIGAKRKK